MVKTINVSSVALTKISVNKQLDGYKIKFYAIKNLLEGDRVRLFVDGKALDAIFIVDSIKLNNAYDHLEDDIFEVVFLEEDNGFTEFEDMPSFEKILRTRPEKEL